MLAAVQLRDHTIVASSLDGSLSTWYGLPYQACSAPPLHFAGASETPANERRRWSGDSEASEPLRHIHAQTVPGGPCWALLPLHGSVGGGQEGGGSKARFLAGLHNRSAVALEVALEDPNGTTLRLLPGALPGHTGWVRTLASDSSGDGDVYSAACNYLRVWRWPAEAKASVLPDHLHDVRMFTGDLLQVRAFEGAVYTSGADGALR